VSFEQVLQALPDKLVLIFIVVSMFSFGLALTPRQVVTPLADIAATLKALVANFVLVPATAYLLVRGFRLQHDIAIGLVLLGCSAGDPFTPKLTKFAGGDGAYALGVMTLISTLTIVYMPIVVPLLLPGVTVDPVQIAKPLVVLVLLPLLIGFAVKRFYPHFADRFAPPLDRLASYIIIAMVTLYIVDDYKEFIALIGSRAILSSALLIVLSIIYGYVLGGRTQIHRNDLAIATGYRGVSAALAIAIRNFPTQHNVVLVALIQALLGVIIMLALIFGVMRRVNKAEAVTA
jgi:BASS family bile acid:Na+ symporter